MTATSRGETIDHLVGWLRAAIARACRVEPCSVTADSNVLDLGLDSLTLVSVLTEIEVAHEIELLPDETLALLEAADVRALARTLATIIDARARRDGAG